MALTYDPRKPLKTGQGSRGLKLSHCGTLARTTGLRIVVAFDSRLFSGRTELLLGHSGGASAGIEQPARSKDNGKPRRRMANRAHAKENRQGEWTVVEFSNSAFANRFA